MMMPYKCPDCGHGINFNHQGCKMTNTEPAFSGYEPEERAMTDDVALLPCPFCGNEPIAVSPNMGFPFIRCETCKIDFDFGVDECLRLEDFKNGIVKPWNTRPQPEPVAIQDKRSPAFTFNRILSDEEMAEVSAFVAKYSDCIVVPRIQNDPVAVDELKMALPCDCNGKHGRCNENSYAMGYNKAIDDLASRNLLKGGV